MEHRRRNGWVFGIVLVILGVIFLAQQLLPTTFGAWLFLVGLSLAFLIGYIMTREYGYLIPGCILMGLGIPIAVVERGETSDVFGGGIVILGLGLSFIAIFLIDLLVQRGRHGGWWPLIPGGILLMVAVALLSDNEQWLVTLSQWWPLILIVAGILILVNRAMNSRSS